VFNFLFDEKASPVALFSRWLCVGAVAVFSFVCGLPALRYSGTQLAWGTLSLVSRGVSWFQAHLAYPSILFFVVAVVASLAGLAALGLAGGAGELGSLVFPKSGLIWTRLLNRLRGKVVVEWTFAAAASFGNDLRVLLEGWAKKAP
jgi:hypothetical protein